MREALVGKILAWAFWQGDIIDGLLKQLDEEAIEQHLAKTWDEEVKGGMTISSERYRKARTLRAKIR